MVEVSSVGLVLTSSVIAAVFTQGVGWIKDQIMLGRSTKFSALLLATELEQYAAGCSKLISDSEEYEHSDGYAGKPRARLPELPAYAADIEWKALSIADANAAFAFRARITSLNGKISSAFDFDDDAGIREVRRAGWATGLDALAIAANLREANGIDPIDLDEDWNFKMHLEEAQVRIVEAERDRLERNRRMLAELESGSAANPDGKLEL